MRTLLLLVLCSGLLAPVLAQETPPAANSSAETRESLGGEKLWGGLFWGGEEEFSGDRDASQAPAIVLEGLRSNPNTRQPRYALVGHDEVELPAEWFTWVRFSTEFFLRVERAGRTEGGELVIDVQFWQQEQLLLSSSVAISPQRPLIIRGPAWRGGFLYASLLLEE